MNQRERVLALLRDGPQCTSDFAAAYLPRFGARIWELRRAGHTITNRRCDKHPHPKRSGCVLYTLEKP